MSNPIIITGASSGIGKALTLALAKQEKIIYAIARHEEQLFLLKKQHPNFINIISADVATPEGREKIKANIPANLTGIYLVNNAGIMAPSGYLENVELSAFRQQISVNTEAPLFLTQILLPNLKGGRILNLSIYSAFKVTVGLGAYAISKAALNMLTEYLKVELKKYDIRVGIALPGLVATKIQEQLSKTECAEIIKHFNELKKAGKVLSPETAAKFLKWLLLETDDEAFSNGIWDIYDKKYHGNWGEGEVISKP